MDSIGRASRRLKRRLGKLWRDFIADECPDEKERVRQERIDNIMHSVILLETMRRWEIELESKTNSRH